MENNVILSVVRELQHCVWTTYIHLILVIWTVHFEQTWFIENDFLPQTVKRDEMW